MALRGHVSSMALEEVLAFLGHNALEGALTVTSGEEAALRLYVQEGRVFLPFSGRRGSYSLGKILRHTGVLSRDALERYMGEAARSRKAELLRAEAVSQEQLADARRRQTAEEIHDLFLWGDAHFEFLPGALPPRVQQDLAASRGLVMDVQGLLMEVARRADERRRIRAHVPSSRALLRGAPGADAAIVAGLAAARIDAERSPFDGRARLEDLLGAWGIPHHGALAAVAALVEEGALALVPADEALAAARERLAAGELQEAGRLLGHALDVAPQGGAPGPELDVARAPAFEAGPPFTASLRLPGPRAAGLLRELVARGAPFSAALRAPGREEHLAALPGEVVVQGCAVTVADVLVALGAVTPAQVVEAGPAVEDLVTPAQRDQARVELVAQAITELALWPAVDVELTNRRVDAPPARGQLVTAVLGPAAREELLRSLAEWAEVVARVPGEDALLVAEAAPGKDPAARFFRRFDLRRSVGELRRRARAGRLEFLRLVARGLDKGYLRAPGAVELRVELLRVLRKEDDPQAGRLARAIVALGQPDALAGITGLPPVRPPVDNPALEGDLEGVGLAAVLQALRDNGRSGTLLITAGRREERLYFHRGQVFILRFADPEAEAFAEFFLGDEGAEQVQALAAREGHGGRVDEAALDPAEVREIKAGFLDILFWEGARFAFDQDELPDEFFSPGEGVTEIALETDRFLLDAIRALTEWDGIRRVVPSGRAVLRFPDLARKMDAIRERGHAEVLTLIDGRQTFDDLVRISGERRLVVGRLVRDLVEEGTLTVVPCPLADGAAPAPAAT
ncbi:MAG: DUF4388 domain-containing protein [Planctomycetes bacterium]|nr:DUF4388 domain-containing protein [Planctomycetota bacterium]